MVLQEIYVLVKHANFDPQYLETLPVYKRRQHLKYLQEEVEEIARQRDNAINASRGKGERMT